MRRAAVRAVEAGTDVEVVRVGVVVGAVEAGTDVEVVRVGGVAAQSVAAAEVAAKAAVGGVVKAAAIFLHPPLQRSTEWASL